MTMIQIKRAVWQVDQNGALWGSEMVHLTMIGFG
jgi:hypothetical protein